MNMHLTYVKLLAMSEYSARVNLLNVRISKSVHCSNSIVFILTQYDTVNICTHIPNGDYQIFKFRNRHGSCMDGDTEDPGG